MCLFFCFVFLCHEARGPHCLASLLFSSLGARRSRGGSKRSEEAQGPCERRERAWRGEDGSEAEAGGREEAAGGEEKA